MSARKTSIFEKCFQALLGVDGSPLAVQKADSPQLELVIAPASTISGALVRNIERPELGLLLGLVHKTIRSLQVLYSFWSSMVTSCCNGARAQNLIPNYQGRSAETCTVMNRVYYSIYVRKTFFVCPCVSAVYVGLEH
eukprot:9182881-Pyramimonas_sp.AAC.1